MDSDNVLSAIKSSMQIIPNYDGNPNQLHRFITTCELILTKYYDVTNPDCFNNSMLLHQILNKIQGKAEEIVNINGVNSWEQLKSVLLKNFGDQRDENCLNRDLVNMKQENESPQDYYNRCMHILNTIINYINLHENVEAVKQCKRNFFQAQTLKTFLAGLKEPLGTTLRAMRPHDMPTALNYIKEEQNIKYFQKANNTQNINKQSEVVMPSCNNKQLPYFPRFPQPYKPMPIYPNRQFLPPHFRNISRPSNPNNYFPKFNQSWNRPQYNNKPAFNNGNSYKQFNSQPKPEPMSGISYRSANIPLRPLLNNYLVHVINSKKCTCSNARRSRTTITAPTQNIPRMRIGTITLWRQQKAITIRISYLCVMKVMNVIRILIIPHLLKKIKIFAQV